MTLAEAKDLAAIVGTIVAFLVAVVTIYKGLEELKKSREQRAEDLRLKRAEFTLAQHRRLFDEPALYSVLCLIDDDSAELAKQTMWDAKRKFLTFIEELCLLRNAGYIDKEVAYYLFGYYASAAYEGKNFQVGMAWEERYWGLFFSFAKESLGKIKGPPPSPEELASLSF